MIVDLLEESKKSGIMVLIMGESGSGKTSALRNLDPLKTLQIWYEPRESLNTLSFFGWRQANVEKPAGHQGLVNELKKALRSNKIETVVVDAWTTYMNNMVDEYNQLNNFGGGWGKWEKIRAKTSVAFGMLKNIAEAGKDVILICHTKTGPETDPRYCPDMPGKDVETQCKAISLQLIAKRIQMGPNQRFLLCSRADDQYRYGVDKSGVLNAVEDNDIKMILDKIRKEMEKRHKELAKKPVANGATSLKDKEKLVAKFMVEVKAANWDKEFTDQWVQTASGKDLYSCSGKELEQLIVRVKKEIKEDREAF